MDISLIAAKILGTYLIISGLFLLTRGKTVPILLRDFFDHPAVVYLTGAILIFLSALFLIQHNVWDGTWRTLITVLAWVVLLKGATYILFPDAMRKPISKDMLEFIKLYGFIGIAAGIFLFYLA